ncbi:phosphoadenosine phosphosulfate reductase family protein [Acidisarcina polymorpha]|uniref:phosphoadenosine phosphosulfate reductase domain-containing protein n=1 Tax=Acidisarcina polymorpha TaxID=2211140 RepID=UPI0039C85FB7
MFSRSNHISRDGDTDFEHQGPISAPDFARDRCAEFGVPFTVVRNPRRNYLQMIEQLGMFPSAQYRQCTSDLKRGPIEKYVRTLPCRLIFNCMGMRSEESPPRAKLQPLLLNSSLTTKSRAVYNWFPIFELSVADVLTGHWEHRIPLHRFSFPSITRTVRTAATCAASRAGCAFSRRTLTCSLYDSMFQKPSMLSLNWSRRSALRCVRPAASCRS